MIGSTKPILLVAGGFLLGIAAAFLAAWGLNAAEQIKQTAVAQEQQKFQREPPLLLNPPDGATFENVAEVKLEWQWKRPLADDEVYDLRVWRDGDPPYGITWTTDNDFDLSGWLLQQQPGVFYWTVAVLKKGEPAQEITELAPTRQITMTDIKLDIIELPPGFDYQLYTRLPVTQPTVITFGPDNQLYVLFVNGEIVRLEDADGDRYAESSNVIFNDPQDQLTWAVGLAFHKDTIYVSDSGKISALSDQDGDGTLDTVTPIVTGLPTLLHVFHSNNGIAFGPDGKLYVGVGATTDHGPIRLENEASILRMNPDGSDLEVFATGFRNPYDLVFSPAGELFTADNSPDEMDDRLFYLPPEELDMVQRGKHYGFPDVYGKPAPGQNSEAPVAELFTSSASAGLTYYAAEQFPSKYHNGIFLAQFGTGAPYPASRGVNTGQMVVYIPLNSDGKGGYEGIFEPFARFRTELGDYSPIDVTVGLEGELYIAEWTTSTIFRVTYSGEPQPASELTPDSATQPAMGEIIFLKGAEGTPACVTCHLMEGQGVGPSLAGLDMTSRVSGLSPEDYIRQSIREPDAYVVEGFTAGVMYQEYGQRLSAEQIDALVEYVLSLSE